jgi:hypothetical protein
MFKLLGLAAAGGRRDARTGTWLYSPGLTKLGCRSTEGRTKQQVRVGHCQNRSHG